MLNLIYNLSLCMHICQKIMKAIIYSCLKPLLTDILEKFTYRYFIRNNKLHFYLQVL